MPARTPTKKPAQAKKPAAAARKPARSAPPGNGKSAKAAPPVKANGDLAQANARIFEIQTAHDALRSDSEGLRRQLREKDDLLTMGKQRISALERELETAQKGAKLPAGLESQLREVQARLTAQKAQLEAARAEAENLREATTKTRAPSEPGNLRCPRCGAHMTEYTHADTVRADRCDGCHGIFFDNGELETVMKHHDEQLAAGQKHWYSGLFGKR